MGIILRGEFCSAEVFQEQIDPKLKQQILNLLNNPVTKDAIIKYMPDAHPGKFFPVGLYGEFAIENGIIPSLIGNDAGCGITAAMIELPKKKFSFDKLDRVINDNIPTGHSNHRFIHETYDNLFYDLVADVNKEIVWKSFNTLGSGNHFIEIDQDSDKNFWLIVHSGSRYLGNAILEYWLNYCKENNSSEIYELGIIKNEKMIHKYVNDIHIARKFADYNRDQIIKTICKKTGINVVNDQFINSCHNYVSEDIGDNKNILLVRKGVSFSRSQIPVSINPAEGHLLVKATNPEIKYSLPHGAGRAIARKEVANSHTVNEYKKDMKNSGIHCSTITKDNLDECPKAYRNREYLEWSLEHFQLGNVIDEWKPVYVYKPKE
jgi:RNA-splicing ligase RtcB